MQSNCSTKRNNENCTSIEIDRSIINKTEQEQILLIENPKSKNR